MRYTGELWSGGRGEGTGAERGNETGDEKEKENENENENENERDRRRGKYRPDFVRHGTFVHVRLALLGHGPFLNLRIRERRRLITWVHL